MSVTLRNLLSASLAVTPFPRDLNISTTFNNVPEEGQPFWALTRNGVVVRIEANDDHGHFFSGKDRDYTRADLFCWWMDADDIAPVVPTADDEYAWASALGREED